jgi:basic membrane lipoprotein Med (substrate-binding protein (PBP1-ABC) superfamily)
VIALAHLRPVIGRRSVMAAWCGVLAAAASGCDRASAGKDGGGFKVAVVIPGSTADQGWNYSAREGAERIGRELRLAEPVSIVENVVASQRKSTLRDYGRNGYRLVICHGYEFNQSVKEVAPDFPETIFIVSGYDQPDPGFGSIVYQLGEAAYLCGSLAARVSRTGCAGFIAAQQVPPVELCYRGYRAGFLAVRPDARVREPVYIDGVNPWEDSAAAKVKTQALLATREPCPVDVLFQNADAASRGVFEAVEQQPAGVFVFGANRDQNATTATSRVLASAVIRVDEAFLRAAREVQAGTYRPHVQSETVASGVIDCVVNPKLEQLIGAEPAAAARAAVSKAREDLVAGRVHPFSSPSR